MGNKRIQIEKKKKRRFQRIVNYRRDNTICHILCIDGVIRFLVIESYEEDKNERNRLRIRYMLKILKTMKIKGNPVLKLNFDKEKLWKKL